MENRVIENCILENRVIENCVIENRVIENRVGNGKPRKTRDYFSGFNLMLHIIVLLSHALIFECIFWSYWTSV